MSYAEIPGFSGFLWLYDEAIASAQDGAVFVEVGVALGHSAAYLARKVIESGKRIEVWAVDPWAGVARNGEQQSMLLGHPRGDFLLFLDQMQTNALEELDQIRVVRATSAQASRMFHGAADLVLIDAAHDYDSVYSDIAYWRDCVKPGGILAGDDHEPNYPGVERACRAQFGKTYETRGSTWYRRM